MLGVIVSYAKERINAYVPFVFLDRGCGRHCNFNDPNRDGPASTGPELPDGAAVPLEGFQEILRLGKSLQIGGKVAAS